MAYVNKFDLCVRKFCLHTDIGLIQIYSSYIYQLRDYAPSVFLPACRQAS